MEFDPRSQTIEKILNDPSGASVKELLDREPLCDSIKKNILGELEGFGPLENVLNDPHVTEILIDRFDKIYIEKGGKLEKIQGQFFSPVTYHRFLKNILLEINRVADQRHPLVDGSLSSGTRVHISLPPVSLDPVVSFRKHSQESWDFKKAIAFQTVSEPVAARLKIALQERKNILVCGTTGSGKTTFLRTLLNEVESSERIITIEDLRELHLERSNHVSLLTRASLEGLFPAVTLQDLVRNALRMRPDRLVVGEIRGEEALVFLDAVSTGHAGSMSSIHGATCIQALQRLEQLALRGAPQWPLESIRKMIFEGVQIVICLARKSKGRKVSQICELAGLESFGYLLEPWEV